MGHFHCNGIRRGRGVYSGLYYDDLSWPDPYISSTLISGDFAPVLHMDCWGLLGLYVASAFGLTPGDYLASSWRQPLASPLYDPAHSLLSLLLRGAQPQESRMRVGRPSGLPSPPPRDRQVPGVPGIDRFQLYCQVTPTILGTTSTST